MFGNKNKEEVLSIVYERYAELSKDIESLEKQLLTVTSKMELFEIKLSEQECKIEKQFSEICELNKKLEKKSTPTKKATK